MDQKFATIRSICGHSQEFVVTFVNMDAPSRYVCVWVKCEKCMHLESRNHFNLPHTISEERHKSEKNERKKETITNSCSATDYNWLTEWVIQCVDGERRNFASFYSYLSFDILFTCLCRMQFVFDHFSMSTTLTNNPKHTIVLNLT